MIVNSHVAKTGDIRDFVIIEESGIAKGIRRIIAITGEEARQASHDANEIEAKWEKIVKLEGVEKEKGIKGFEVVRIRFFAHLRSPSNTKLTTELMYVGAQPCCHLGRSQGCPQATSLERT
jgi:alanyl-tRNA synthetase